MANKVKLYIGMPTTGTVVDSVTYKLRELEKKYSDRIEFIYPNKCIRRIFHDYARNMVVQEFLDSGADVLWFLDSDVTPPDHVLDLITEHGDKWDLAGAPYPVFMQPKDGEHPAVVYTVYRKNAEGGLYATDVPESGTDWVDGVGTGCMFLKRSVFERLEQPYFEFKYKNESRCLTEGEDLGFCKKVNALGLRFFIDYSMACKHQKNVCLLEVNNYAVEYAKKTVNAYDRDVRVKVEALARQNLELKRQLAELRAQQGQTRPALILPNSKLVLP